MSEETKFIYSLIPAAMAEIGAIEKSRDNQLQHYKFRGIDDIYKSVQPIFSRLGIFVIPEVIEEKREERTTKQGSHLIYTVLRVCFKFYAKDGSFVEAITVGEAMDSGDKSANKAMSAAMKYALIQTFVIPTEGDNDTESHNHEVQPKKTLTSFAPPSQEPERLKKGYFDPSTQRKVDPRGFPHGDYPPPQGILTDKQLQLLRFRSKQKQIPDEQYLNMIVAMGVENDADIPRAKVNDALAWLDNYKG